MEDDFLNSIQSRVINASVARTMNECVVMSVIKRYTALSGVEISEKLRIDPSTTSRILRGLAEKGLIVKEGVGVVGRKGGRRPILWRINPDGIAFLGIDLEASFIRCVLVNLTGEILLRRVIATPDEPDPETVLRLLVELIQSVLAESPIDKELVTGIGVSVPGQVNSDLGTSVFAITFKNWRNVPIAARIEERFGIPVRVDHDIRAMTFGERWFGAASDLADFICVGLRVGIGLGLVANGKVYRGGSQFAGDMGHVPIDPSGPVCRCGRRGCLEAMAGEAAIAQKLQAQWGREFGVQHSVSINDLHLALKEGDPAAVDVVWQSGGLVGQALAYLVNLLDPGLIIVGGTLLEINNVMSDAIKEAYQRHRTNYAERLPRIAKASFGSWCFAVGAAALWCDAYFDGTALGDHLGNEENVTIDRVSVRQ